MRDKPRSMVEIIDSVPYIYTVVLELLERACLKPGDPGRVSFYEKAADASDRWVMFGALTLACYPANLLEYGTGIGWAWLTPDGKRLLDWLREYGCDDEKWPKEGEDGRYYTTVGAVARDWNQP